MSLAAQRHTFTQMSDIPEKEYFERRAAEELAAAELADDQRAAQSHRELSDRYRRRADASNRDPSEQPEPRGAGVLPKEFSIVP